MGSKGSTRKTLAELQGTRACDFWHHGLVDQEVYFKEFRQEWKGKFGLVSQWLCEVEMEDGEQHEVIVNIGSDPVRKKLQSFMEDLPFAAFVRAHGEGEKPDYYFLE